MKYKQKSHQSILFLYHPKTINVYVSINKKTPPGIFHGHDQSIYSIETELAEYDSMSVKKSFPVCQQLHWTGFTIPTVG